MNQQTMGPYFGYAPSYEQQQNARFQTMGGHQAATYGNYSQPTPLSPVRSYIYGRPVAAPNEITPQEVPMDGTIALFPMQDLSCVYAKTWGADGTIKTMRFVPEPVNDPQNEGQTEGSMDALFASLNQRLDKIEKMLTRKPYHNKPKKEVVQNAAESNE